MENNNGYNGNKSLKNIGLSIHYEPAQIEEYIKCKKDPIYFIKNYCKVVSLDKGFVNFNLYEYQERFLNTVHDNRKVAGMLSRQMGKCVGKDSIYCIRNKITGEILNVAAEEFHNICGIDK
jgi:hypothetical protein